MVTRPSARARWAPAQWWMPCPKATWYLAFSRSRSNSWGSSNRRGSRLAAPGRSIIVLPAGMSTPATVVRTLAMRNCARSGLSNRSVSSTKFGMRVAITPQPLLQVGSLRDDPQREREQSHGGLLPPGEQVRGEQRDVVHLRRRPVREGGGGHRRHDVVAWRPAAILDVRRELLVEELERLVLQVLGQLGQSGGEQPVIGLGDAFQVGDHQQRERCGVGADELAAARLDQLVELTIGEPAHELLVGPQPSWRQEPHHQRSVRGVPWRVERRKLVAERQLVAVALDEVPHVVALERLGESLEGPAHRVARREGRRVVVDRERLLVAGHHEDAVMRLLPHRRLSPHRIEVRIRIVLHGSIAEEVRG